MKILTDLYQYSPLTRTDHPNGRFYQINEDGIKLPSVTTILSKTSPESKKKTLDDWRKKVGDEEADRITNESLYIGEHLHKNLENKLLGKDETSGPLISKVLANLIEKKALSRVDEVWGIEAPLYYPELYAGTTDLVGVFEGTPHIMDFKNSRKAKKKEWIEDYFLQLAAYSLAHNKVHGTNIKGGVIMMAVRDLKYLEFQLTNSEMQKYQDEWLKRVDKFYTENPDFGKD